MRIDTRLRRGTAVAVMMGLLALGTTACFPDVAAGEPIDPHAAALFRAVNQDRANHGLPPLGHSPKLDNLAGTWSWIMGHENWLRHQNLAAILYSDEYANFYTLGENIIVAPGHYSPGQVEAAWMSSAPHRANILSRSFNVVGVGWVWGPDGRVWATLNFGGL